jgi:adenylate cyclase
MESQIHTTERDDERDDGRNSDDASSPPRRQILRLRYDLDGEPHSIEVGSSAFFIGRAPNCQLVLHDESVSRRHAHIAKSESGWTLTDLGSKNGVKLNTYKTEQQRLRDGDRVDLGAVRLYVEIGASAAASPANVVFETGEDRSRRTEFIDVSQLEPFLGASPGSRQADSGGSASSVVSIASPRGEHNERSAEGGTPLQLFGAAAEALISCDSLDETLERILELVFRSVPAERGVICLYDEANDHTEPKVMRTREGSSDDAIRISSHIANDVIKRRQSLLVNDPMLDERFGGAESVILMNIRSAMCAPLYREGRVVGFVYVDRQSVDDPFTTQDLQVLSSLGVLSAVAVEQAALRDGLRDEREKRARLARYSSPAVVDRIVREGSAEMAADEAEVTVLFADLAGFTALSEANAPAVLIRMLNQVFERLTESIFEFEGTLDKFRGDGMMAFFGAPLAMPDHAERAVAAALRMQEQLAELNSYTRDRELSMRIGINSGPVVVGDIGSPERKDYTVIGDVVNTASRLESAVALPGQVVIGEATWKLVSGLFAAEALEPARLKGKRKLVQPYRVTGPLLTG